MNKKIFVLITNIINNGQETVQCECASFSRDTIDAEFGKLQQEINEKFPDDMYYKFIIEDVNDLSIEIYGKQTNEFLYSAYLHIQETEIK